MKRWLEQSPDVSRPGFVYFGSLAPQLVGVEYTFPSAAPILAETWTRNRKPTEPWQPDSGWHAVSANVVCGKPSTIVNYRQLYHLDRSPLQSAIDATSYITVECESV